MQIINSGKQDHKLTILGISHEDKPSTAISIQQDMPWTENVISHGDEY